MDVRAEQDFTIDGIKSRIHCIVTPTWRPKAGDKIFYHYHDYIEILYGLDDGATVWINGDAYPFDTGDLFLINSGEPHTVTSTVRAMHICIKFSPGILYSDEQALLEYKYVVPFLSKGGHQKRFCKGELEGLDLDALMHGIIREWEAKSVAYEMVIRSGILTVFAGILRYWYESRDVDSAMQIGDTVKTAIDYVDKHYADVTEHEVAEACSVSYNHFSRVFKKTMGKSFSDYLTQIRVREAERLLLTTDKNVTEIALEVGFSSSSHFISRFGALRGITPRQFRARVKEISVK